MLNINSYLTYQQNNFNIFKNVLEYVYNNNTIYRKKMDEVGVEPENINNIFDITMLPILTKEDLQIDYPYGYITFPNNIVRYHSSSGTTGKPLIIGLTENDIKRRNENILKMLKLAGLKKDDVVQIALGFGMFTGGLSFYETLIANGYTVIPSSTSSTKMQIFYMQNLHTTFLISSPSYVMRLYEYAKKENIDLKELNLRVLKLGSELLTDEMRKTIKKAYGENVIISQDYGMTETMGPGIGMECTYEAGLHINTDSFIYELVDPITKLPSNTNVGELVITSLCYEAFPIIRYATR